MYSQDTLDRIFAETPGGCETSASAICTMLRSALFARARELKAQQKADKQEARDNLDAKEAKQRGKGFVVKGVEHFGVPLGDGQPITGLVRKKHSVQEYGANGKPL